MSKRHEPPARTPAVHLILNDDGTWPTNAVSAALLFDIRRTVDEQTSLQRETLRVLRRIDKRFARRVKLR